MSENRRKVLCALSELSDPGTLELNLGTDQELSEIFLVRKGGRVFGYRNRCPHTGVNLNWMPNQFLDLGGGFLQCATHGALFQVEDGLCLRGPCVGERLTPIKLAIEHDEVILLEE